MFSELAAIGSGVGSAIVGGASAVASSVGNAMASGIGKRGQQRRQYKYNKKMAEYQNSLALQNWKLQNEYNSPSNQMKMLRDAGINPRVAFANGNPFQSATMPDASHVPELEIPNYTQGFQMPNILNTINGLRMTEAQLDVLNQQAKEIKSRAELNDEKRIWQEIKNLFGHSSEESRRNISILKEAKLYHDLLFNFGEDALLWNNGATDPSFAPFTYRSHSLGGYRGQLMDIVKSQASYMKSRSSMMGKMDNNYLPYIGDTSALIRSGVNMLGGMFSKSLGQWVSKALGSRSFRP